MPRKPTAAVKAKQPKPSESSAPPRARAREVAPPDTEKKPRKKRSDAHEPTDMSRRLVMLCVATGMTNEQVAAEVGIAESTLKVHYKHELATGAQQITMRIVSNLATIATQTQDRSQAIRAADVWLSRVKPIREREPDVEFESEGRVKFTLRIGDRPPSV